MSDIITVQYTLFVNLDDEGHEESRKYGYRVYNDMEATYDNLYPSFTELKSSVNKRNIFTILEDKYPDFYFGDEVVEFNGEFLRREQQEG